MVTADTPGPENPSSSCQIRYTVFDAEGNAAKSLVRWVSVVCPAGEVLCPGSSDGGGTAAPHCSCAGICGLESPTCSRIAPAAEAALPSALELGRDGSVEAAGGYSVALQLLGPAVVVLPLGSRPYHRCSGPVAQPDCDPGVTATRLEPGDYDHRVVACEERARSVLGVEVGARAARGGRGKGTHVHLRRPPRVHSACTCPA